MDMEGNSCLADGLICFRMLRKGDEGTTGTQNAGFLMRNGGDGGPEPFLMIEGDVGKYGKEGVDDVGGVEASPETDFKDGYVDRGLRLRLR